ncbi:hypothetical protein M758_9G036200 [Ceratodon purpureus]|nr:hypothetical protein M758_9G036200 [Ceratodon purpureus]
MYMITYTVPLIEARATPLIVQSGASVRGMRKAVLNFPPVDDDDEAKEDPLQGKWNSSLQKLEADLHNWKNSNSQYFHPRCMCGRRRGKTVAEAVSEHFSRVLRRVCLPGILGKHSLDNLSHTSIQAFKLNFCAISNRSDNRNITSVLLIENSLVTKQSKIKSA